MTHAVSRSVANPVRTTKRLLDAIPNHADHSGQHAVDRPPAAEFAPTAIPPTDIAPTDIAPTDIAPTDFAAATEGSRREPAAVEAMLRSIVGSAEPAVAFTSLAATVVPAFADGCRIAIVDEQHAAFRIHYPREPGPVVPAAQVVVSRVSAAACGGEPAYWGTVTFEWHDGAPVGDADGLTARRLTEGVAALVRHERLVAADYDDQAAVTEPARSA